MVHVTLGVVYYNRYVLIKIKFKKRNVSYFLIFWCFVFLAIPLVIVAASLAATQTNGYGSSTYCWLSTENMVILAFIVPVGLVVLVSVFKFTGKLLIPKRL